MKNTTPFGFYYLDREYIEAMQAVDEHVPDANYEDNGRARKFYCGPVMTQDGVDYFVPVSHEQKDTMEIPGSRKNGFPEYYGVSLYGNDKEKTGNLDFRHMLPCVDPRFIKKIDDNNELSNFGKEQFRFCRCSENRIRKTAQSAYNNIVSQDYPFLNKTSIDYETVLDTAWEHLDKIEECELADKRKKMTDRANKADILAANINTPSDDIDKIPHN